VIPIPPALVTSGDIKIGRFLLYDIPLIEHLTLHTVYCTCMCMKQWTEINLINSQCVRDKYDTVNTVHIVRKCSMYVISNAILHESVQCIPLALRLITM
jgi:hypothetical protein